MPQTRDQSRASRQGWFRRLSAVLALTVFLCLSGALSAPGSSAATTGTLANKADHHVDQGHGTPPAADSQHQPPEPEAPDCPTADTGCLSASAAHTSADIPTPSDAHLSGLSVSRTLTPCRPEHSAPPRTPTPLELSISRT